MDLLCCEQASSVENVAYDDPTLLKDRVLQNLLRTEDSYSPACASFPAVQDEVTPEMRKIVAEWMMEVRSLLGPPPCCTVPVFGKTFRKQL